MVGSIRRYRGHRFPTMYGFDNMAGTLTMSPALMEAYLSASGKISRLAIGDASPPKQAVFDVPPDTAQNYHIEGLPFGTRGGILINYQFPADGEYTFKVKGVTGYFQAVLGGVKGEQLEVTVDGPLNEHGVVVDFADLKAVVQREVVERYDHRYLNDLIDNPTAELVAHEIWKSLEASGLAVARVRLWETADCAVEVGREP